MERVFSLYLSIRGPGKILESHGKVLDFFVSKRVGTVSTVLAIEFDFLVIYVV